MAAGQQPPTAETPSSRERQEPSEHPIVPSWVLRGLYAGWVSWGDPAVVYGVQAYLLGLLLIKCRHFLFNFSQGYLYGREWGGQGM